MAERSPSEVLDLYPAHDGSLWGLLASRVAAKPDESFCRFEERDLTWSQFAARAAGIAAWLSEHGVQPGDRVAAMLDNSDTFAALFFAAARLGAAVVPVNPDLKPAEARYIVGHAEARGILCMARNEGLAREAAGWSADGAARWSADGAAQALAHIEFIEQVESLDHAVCAADVEPPMHASPEAIGIIIYTSGTTGFPKGVMHSQRNMVLTGEAFVERLHLQPDDRLLIILPMFHLNAIFYSLVGAVAAGASIVIQRKFSASSFWQLAARTGATSTNILAAIGNILLRRPRGEFVPTHSIRKIYGGPYSEELVRVFQDELGVPHMIEGYGMTEIPGAFNNPFDGRRKPLSIGLPARHPRLANFTEAMILDDEHKPVPKGSVGELAIKTPILMKGYFRDPEQTAAAFHEGWFLTGDLARREADGYTTFVARKKDIIRRRGENVSGAELDRVIGEHPAVLEVAAVPVDADLGEDDILVAVVPREGATLTEDEIVEWCKARLAAIKLPRYVLITGALPKTHTHRVAKFQLKADKSLKSRARDMQSSS